MSRPSKVGGSELVYAFRHLGVFNHGTASLKKIQEGFENAFSVRLGNITKQYQEVLSRKKEHYGILDRSKEALQRAVEELDQKYFRKKGRLTTTRVLINNLTVTHASSAKLIVQKGRPEAALVYLFRSIWICGIL